MANITEQSAIITKPDGSTQGDPMLLNKMLEWVGEAEGSTPEINWRTESEEDYNFYSGDQDSADVLTKLESQKRINSTFNTILPKINMIYGLAAQTNKAPYIYPVNTEDDAIAEIMNGAFKHYRYKLKLGDAENECFEHMIKSGRSMLYFWVDKTNPFRPTLKCKRLDGRDFMIDPTSKEYDLSDARYVIMDKWLSIDEIKERWPNFDADSVRSFSTSSKDTPIYYSMVRDVYRLTEMWYRKTVQVVWFLNPLTNQPDNCTPEVFQQFVGALKKGVVLNGQRIQYDKPIQTYPAFKQKVFYAIFSNYTILESGPSPYKHDYFPCALYGAYKNEIENRWFSVITMMKDPQRSRNTMRRQLVHLLQTAPKGILMHEIGALTNPDGYDTDSSKPNFRLEVNKGYFDKVKFTENPQISPIYSMLDEVFENDIKETSGVTHDLMGVEKSSREAGLTVRMRQQAGIAVLYMLFDHFRKSRIRGGEIFLSMIQQYITYEDIIRIEGPEGEYLMKVNSQTNPQVQGFNDLSAYEYDLRVDEAVDTTTMRMAVAEMLTDFSQNNPGVIPPDIIMEYSDLPLSVRNKVMAYHQQQQEREERMLAAELQVKREEHATKAMADTAVARIHARAQKRASAAKPTK